MNLTNRQKGEMGDVLQEAAIYHIRDNLKPDDVFDSDQLKEWAVDQRVDEIFDAAELEKWAKNNGFIEDPD